MQANLRIVGQITGGMKIEEGMHFSNDAVLSANTASGLMVMVKGTADDEIFAAQKASEIFLDDMLSNLPLIDSQSSGISAGSCMQESFDNINDFLCQQIMCGKLSDQSGLIAMSAVHASGNQINYSVTQGFSCLLCRQGELIDLTKNAGIYSELLGQDSSYEANVEVMNGEDGDLLFMANKEDVEALSEDFIRMTLSRFPDELDMVIKQINTRANRSGLDRSPDILVGQFEAQPEPKTSWFDKFRN